MPLYYQIVGIQGEKGDKGDTGIQGGPGDTMIKRAWNYTTDSNGTWTGTIPSGATISSVAPRTSGEFLSSINVNGTSCTINFRKFKTGGLGITLGTLLTVSVFEASPGAVNFDLVCFQPIS